jgi:hypothetical protein
VVWQSIAPSVGEGSGLRQWVRWQDQSQQGQSVRRTANNAVASDCWFWLVVRQSWLTAAQLHRYAAPVARGTVAGEMFVRFND